MLLRVSMTRSVASGTDTMTGATTSAQRLAESAPRCRQQPALLKCQSPQNGGGANIVSHPFPPRRVD